MLWKHVKEHVFVVSCIVLISSLLVNGKDYLKYIQTPLCLLLLGWPAVRMEKSLLFIFPSLRSIVQSKKVSDKQWLLLWVLIKASIKGTLIKWLAARSFKFQWRNLIKEDFQRLGFLSTSLELSKNAFEKIVSKNKTWFDWLYSYQESLVKNRKEMYNAIT